MTNNHLLSESRHVRHLKYISEMENLISTLFAESIPEYHQENLFSTEKRVSLLPQDGNHRNSLQTLYGSLEISKEQEKRLKQLCKKDPIIYPELVWNLIYSTLNSKFNSKTSSVKRNLIYFTHRAFQICDILYPRSHSFRSSIQLSWLFTKWKTILENPTFQSHDMYNILLNTAFTSYSVWSSVPKLTHTMSVLFSNIQKTHLASFKSSNTPSNTSTLGVSDTSVDTSVDTSESKSRAQIQYVLSEIPKYSQQIQELADRISACLLVIFPKKNLKAPILYGPIAVTLQDDDNQKSTKLPVNVQNHQNHQKSTKLYIENSLASMLKSTQNSHLYPIISSALYHLNGFLPKITLWRTVLPITHYRYLHVDNLFHSTYKTVSLSQGLGFLPCINPVQDNSLDSLLNSNLDIDFSNLFVFDSSKVEEIQDITPDKLTESNFEQLSMVKSLSNLLPKLPDISQASFPSKMPRITKTSKTKSPDTTIETLDTPLTLEVNSLQYRPPNLGVTNTPVVVDGGIPELYSVAPIVDPGSWQYYWELDTTPANESGIERNHRFLGSGDDEAVINIRQDSRFASLVNPSVNLERSQEKIPLKTCNAPLTGKFGKFLCPRKSARVCPFHGIIVPRDDLGYPIPIPENSLRRVRPRDVTQNTQKKKRKKFNQVSSSLSSKVKKLHPQVLELKQQQMNNIRYINSFFDTHDSEN